MEHMLDITKVVSDFDTGNMSWSARSLREISGFVTDWEVDRNGNRSTGAVQWQ
jgi:hypothetical protein